MPPGQRGSVLSKYFSNDSKSFILESIHEVVLRTKTSDTTIAGKKPQLYKLMPDKVIRAIKLKSSEVSTNFYGLLSWLFQYLSSMFCAYGATEGIAVFCAYGATEGIAVRSNQFLHHDIETISLKNAIDKLWGQNGNPAATSFQFPNPLRNRHTHFLNIFPFKCLLPPPRSCWVHLGVTNLGHRGWRRHRPVAQLCRGQGQSRRTGLLAGQAMGGKNPRKVSTTGVNLELNSVETRPKNSATTSACSLSTDRTSSTVHPTTDNLPCRCCLAHLCRSRRCLPARTSLSNE
jgi:hypothetical protein